MRDAVALWRGPYADDVRAILARLAQAEWERDQARWLHDKLTSTYEAAERERQELETAWHEAEGKISTAELQRDNARKAAEEAERVAGERLEALRPFSAEWARIGGPRTADDGLTHCIIRAGDFRRAAALTADAEGVGGGR